MLNCCHPALRKTVGLLARGINILLGFLMCFAPNFIFSTVFKAYLRLAEKLLKSRNNDFHVASHEIRIKRKLSNFTYHLGMHLVSHY